MDKPLILTGILPFHRCGKDHRRKEMPG